MSPKDKASLRRSGLGTDCVRDLEACLVRFHVPAGWRAEDWANRLHGRRQRLKTSLDGFVAALVAFKKDWPEMELLVSTLAPDLARALAPIDAEASKSKAHNRSSIPRALAVKTTTRLLLVLSKHGATLPGPALREVVETCLKRANLPTANLKRVITTARKSRSLAF